MGAIDLKELSCFKARKEHQCRFCCEPIDKGERYWRVAYGPWNVPGADYPWVAAIPWDDHFEENFDVVSIGCEYFSDKYGEWGIYEEMQDIRETEWMQARVDEMDRPEAICRKSVMVSELHLSPRELKELEMINDKLHPQPDKVKLINEVIIV